MFRRDNSKASGVMQADEARMKPLSQGIFPVHQRCETCCCGASCTQRMSSCRPNTGGAPSAPSQHSACSPPSPRRSRRKTPPAQETRQSRARPSQTPFCMHASQHVTYQAHQLISAGLQHARSACLHQIGVCMYATKGMATPGAEPLVQDDVVRARPCEQRLLRSADR